jgi:hypothetical protein
VWGLDWGDGTMRNCEVSMVLPEWYIQVSMSRIGLLRSLACESSLSPTELEYSSLVEIQYFISISYNYISLLHIILHPSLPSI